MIRNLPIRRKIILITMVAITAALVLAAIELIAYDVLEARQELETAMTTTAAITADNAMAAVSFSDTQAASDTLNALRSDSTIVMGCIYASSNLLAQYIRSGESGCPPQPDADGLTADANYLTVVHPISVNGKRIGTVQLRASLQPLQSRMRRDVLNLAVVLLLAAALAYVLSLRLQRWISSPLLSLAGTAKHISETNNYSVRARKQADDEIGVVVDSVNEMLDRIESHQAEREAAAREREMLLLREQALRMEAVEANRLKDEFLATLSHELRTPLTAIVGWTTLIREGLISPEKIKTGLEAVERNARAQARLIEDLLDVSRIASGKFDLELSDVRLRSVLDATIESIRPATDAKQIRIVVSSSEEDVHFTGDPIRFQQAIANILSNAMKFTPPDGRIEITVTRTGDHLAITVADTGIGIPAFFLPHVFDSFRQADGSTTRAVGGLGLGLAITKHIIELHGGSISAQSAGVGKGSTFTITIPLTKDKTQQTPQTITHIR
jgi:signal transduction histidine kinase